MGIQHLPCHHVTKTLLDQIDIEGVNKALDEGGSSTAEDHADEPTGGHLGRLHEDPSERHIDGGITSARIGPVDDNRTSRAHHHVQWMEVEVEETISTTERGVMQPARSRKLVKPTMEIGQHSPQTRNHPWALAHHCHHVNALDALNDHAEAVIAHVLNRRYWVSQGTDILHDVGLACHRTTLPGAPKDTPRAILEDLSVSTRRQQGSGVRHPGQGSCRHAAEIGWRPPAEVRGHTSLRDGAAARGGIRRSRG